MKIKEKVKENEMAEELQSERARLVDQLGYDSFMYMYQAAIKEIRTKIEILTEDFAVRNDYNPIHHMECRLKSTDSIEKKLTKLEKTISIQSARQNIFDIAGVRVVCNFIDDVYTVADMLMSQDDLRVETIKDYVKNPKENVYSSLHLVVGVPVFLLDRCEEIYVEIQIRSVAMDFWASLEHELRYKSNKAFSDHVNAELKAVADSSMELDRKMQQIFDEISLIPTEDGEIYVKPKLKNISKE